MNEYYFNTSVDGSRIQEQNSIVSFENGVVWTGSKSFDNRLSRKNLKSQKNRDSRLLGLINNVLSLKVQGDLSVYCPESSPNPFLLSPFRPLLESKEVKGQTIKSPVSAATTLTFLSSMKMS